MAESWKKLYLFFYNLSMFLGFAYVLTVMSANYLANPDVFPTECWSTVGSFFKASERLQHFNKRHLFLGVACSDVSGGVESSVWAHQGLCSNCHDPGNNCFFLSSVA